MQGLWAVIRDLTSLPQGTVKTRQVDTVNLAAEDQLARRGRKVQREGAQGAQCPVLVLQFCTSNRE